MSRVIAGGQGIQVADNLVGFAHIVSNDMDQTHINLTTLGKFHDRYVNTFLVDFVGIRAEPPATDVDHVRGRGKITHKPAISERRVDEGKVV